MNIEKVHCFYQKIKERGGFFLVKNMNYKDYKSDSLSISSEGTLFVDGRAEEVCNIYLCEEEAMLRVLYELGQYAFGLEDVVKSLFDKEEK